MDKQTPEMIARVLALQATGATQLEISRELNLHTRTVRKLMRHPSIPAPSDATPDQLRTEWFGLLARRIRVAAGNEDDTKMAELIKAGAILLNTPDDRGPEDAAAATGGRQAAGGELTGAATTDKPTLKDIKAMKPMVIHVPVGKTAAGGNEDENENEQ